MTFLQTIAVMCLLVTTCRTALKDCKDTWSEYCWTEIGKNITKCDEDFYRRNCKRTCGLCGVCTDILLTQCVSLIHRCHENLMRVRCRKTCSLCPEQNERRGRGRVAASTTPTTSANVQLGTPMLTVNSHLIAIHNVSLNTTVNFKCFINRPISSSTLHLYKVAGSEAKVLNSTTGSSDLYYALTAKKCQDAGFFYCLSENHIGQTNSTTVQLNIFCRPRLVSNALKTAEIVQGSDGQFAFEVVAYPSPSVEHFNYQKEETMSPSRQEPVRSGFLSGECKTNSVFPHLAACKVDIKGATLNDGGLYSFTVRNKQGPASVTFRLTVTAGTPTAPTLTVGGQVSNYTVRVSNYVDIRCTAHDGYGKPLELLKVTSNGIQPLKTSEAPVLLFRLENTTCEDAGSYICRPRTDQRNTASAQLHVLCSPQLASGNIIDPVQVTEGSEGQVTFEVTAHPVPTLASFTYREEDSTSYSEEQPVRSGLLSGSCEGHALAAHLAVCRLDITNPAVTDSGAYNVKVRNSLGTTNVIFTLNVIACTDLLTVCWRYTSQCQESWMQEGCRKTCSACSMFEETTAAATSPGESDRSDTQTDQCGNYTSREESSDLGVKAGAAKESVIRDRLDMVEADIEPRLRTRLAEIVGKLDELASLSREIKSYFLSQLSQMEADSKHPPVN